MHNVKKTPATEAHAANVARQRTEKLKLYVELRDKIFAKRDREEFDEEILLLSSELLKKNPDFYTFWTIRRKTLSIIRNQNEGETDEAHSERLKKLFEEELSLTKDALLSNPKSYGAWHHRFWTFRNHPCADLQKELDLCEKALSIDCRNFHCWDHRRSVAKLANLTVEDELKFSDKLIAQNPSNYSAWHYRATLLPKARPDLDESSPFKMAISEDCLVEEFEKTKNICCMNSEDQTAWTYCRWLCETAYSAINENSGRERPRKCLEDIVEFCNELIKIDKEEIPWEMVALARVKWFLDGSNFEELKDIFEKIKQLDPQRRNMYDDLLLRCSDIR